MRRSGPLGLLPALALTALGCGHALPETPREAYTRYMGAYADGDGRRLWELSTPAARADAARVRMEIVRLPTDPDPVRRVQLEGIFGASVERVTEMDERAFFVWAIEQIHRRLGPAFVRRAVESFELVSVRKEGKNVAVAIYREPSGRVNELRLRRIEDHWYVDTSPFPRKEQKAGGRPEKEVQEPARGDDAPLQPGEKPWDPAQDRGQPGK